ncbi:Uncharacterised protein [Fusobacterium necrogenes]|uniref:PAS domain-containing protein n=1 Tax=Fusobacterium necrogenes TaxID=858 RepID=A0A377GWI3_9FUSO|nr:hypothetical protein [Fusobacterium necrogenes]STO31319.1 Uncharacterised protein [Fusobacterium necrogenes]
METGFLDKNMLDFIKNILDIDLSKDLIFIKNNNFEYSYVNSVFCDMFNLKIEDVIGKKDKDIFKDKMAILTCQKSDIKAYDLNYLIHEEEIFSKKFRVLKVKINLGNKRDGLLCFAKLDKDNTI